MIEEKDIDFIEKIFDNRYRKVDDCNDIVGNVDERQDKIENSFSESNTKLNILIAILGFIATIIAPVCISFLTGG